MDGGPTLDSPILIAAPRVAVVLEPDGSVAELPPAAARRTVRERDPPIVCHMPATARRLGVDPFPALDVLELFAFVRPAQFCLPTVRGLAAAVGLDAPGEPAAEAMALRDIVTALLGELARLDRDTREQAAAIAAKMAPHGWPWAAAVLRAAAVAAGADGLAVWTRLKEWSDRAPPVPPGAEPVSPGESRTRLTALLGSRAEPRAEQADYASAASFAFAPRDQDDEPRVVLAEAGTGVGKTLGYIAPASVWVDKNDGVVWLSTYTKNLQRQIDRELDRLYPDPAVKARRVVVRKGRENYVCLLNYEDAARAVGGALLPGMRGDAVALGLMARWLLSTRDGDLNGGDFPSWLVELLGPRRTFGLSDQRGECIYSACPHYRKCFIEDTVRKARHADMVIANHALVMIQAAIGDDDPHPPTRYVFDEGHHLFDAADGAFSAHLSGREAAELRRWLRGAEGGRRGRARGLKRRIGDLVEGEQDASLQLTEVLDAAGVLPGTGWLRRLADHAPRGPCEAFLSLIHQQVRARNDSDHEHSIECTVRPPVPGLVDAAADLDAALAQLAAPMAALEQAMAARLDAEADSLDTAARIRLDAACRALRRRRRDMIAPWRAMLTALADETPEPFVDWLSVDRAQGRDVDAGMHRHWVDPTAPFAEAVLDRAHGTLITSATLRDGSGDAVADWAAAEARTGTRHLLAPAIRAQSASPFDYANATKVMVVTDIDRDDPAQVAAAYRELFLAAHGGALGLFTAISRLRAVHGRIAGALDEQGLTLLAQHVDALNATTLVNIFRAEPDYCLLGTDALRDGIDVPGHSLRLIVFDRVPWPRPDLLHRARRAHFGGRAYDDMITRLKLKQAFGRLIRKADDYGVFVMLDSRMPSRLKGAFPEAVTVQRMGLAEAVAATRAFLADRPGARLTATGRLP